jgi:hypothetical protein
MDGQLIYPTTPPATALYQTSRTLDMPGSSVSISRLGPHKFNKPSMLSAGATSPQKLEGFDSDKAIYEIIRTPLVLTKLELKGKRRSTLPGSIKMERASGVGRPGMNIRAQNLTIPRHTQHIHQEGFGTPVDGCGRPGIGDGEAGDRR